MSWTTARPAGTSQLDRRDSCWSGRRRRRSAGTRRPGRREPRDRRSCPERREGHGLLRPVRRHRRAGGHPQVRLQGLQRATSTRSSYRSPPRPHSSTACGRRPRPGRATSTSSSACTATWSPSRTRTSSAASTTWRGRSRAARSPWSSSASSGRTTSTTSQCAGDLRHGREQGGAQVHAQGRRHQRAHVRAGLRLGQGDPQGHGTEPVRAPRAATRASSIASSRASSCPRSPAASSRVPLEGGRRRRGCT